MIKQYFWMVSWYTKSINMKKEARHVKIKRSHLCKAYTQISKAELAADTRPHIFLSLPWNSTMHNLLDCPHPGRAAKEAIHKIVLYQDFYLKSSIMGTSHWRHCDSIIPAQEVQRRPQVSRTAVLLPAEELTAGFHSLDVPLCTGTLRAVNTPVNLGSMH